MKGGAKIRIKMTDLYSSLCSDLKDLSFSYNRAIAHKKRCDTLKNIRNFLPSGTALRCWWGMFKNHYKIKEMDNKKEWEKLSRDEKCCIILKTEQENNEKPFTKLSQDKARIFLLDRYKIINHIRNCFFSVDNEIVDIILTGKCMDGDDDCGLPQTFLYEGYNKCNDDEQEAVNEWCQDWINNEAQDIDAICNHFWNYDFSDIQDYFRDVYMINNKKKFDLLDDETEDDIDFVDLHEEEKIYIIYLSYGMYHLYNPYDSKLGIDLPQDFIPISDFEFKKKYGDALEINKETWITFGDGESMEAEENRF